MISVCNTIALYSQSTWQSAHLRSRRKIGERPLLDGTPHPYVLSKNGPRSVIVASQDVKSHRIANLPTQCRYSQLYSGAGVRVMCSSTSAAIPAEGRNPPRFRNPTSAAGPALSSGLARCTHPRPTERNMRFTCCTYAQEFSEDIISAWI